MLRLLTLDPTSDLLAPLEALYLAAFPPEERRPVTRMRELHRQRPEFRIEAIVKGEEARFVGFVTTWELGQCRFIDHFATDESVRGQGIGAWVMEQLKVRSTTPLLLEVELPETALAQRRITFYERLGFRCWTEVPYLQPSYAEGIAFLPMHLMSHGDLDVRACGAELQALLHREVYGL